MTKQIHRVTVSLTMEQVERLNHRAEKGRHKLSKAASLLLEPFLSKGPRLPLPAK